MYTNLLFQTHQLICKIIQLYTTYSVHIHIPFVCKNNLYAKYICCSLCKIIWLPVTNLLATSNYLFPLQIRLFGNVDSFVRDAFSIIYPTQLNVRDVQYFVRCTLLFVRYFLFFVRRTNYLFVLLNYLFLVAETNYLVLKNIFLKKVAQIQTSVVLF